MKNNRGERFMFGYVPEMFRGEYAETEEESDRWVASVVAGQQADVRRPPEWSAGHVAGGSRSGARHSGQTGRRNDRNA